jgi:hypothetical protein
MDCKAHLAQRMNRVLNGTLGALVAPRNTLEAGNHCCMALGGLSCGRICGRARCEM